MLLIEIFSILALQSRVTSEPINHITEIRPKSLLLNSLSSDFAGDPPGEMISYTAEEDGEYSDFPWDIVNPIRVSVRYKRDLVSTFTSVAQTILTGVLSPFKTVFDGIFTAITNFLTKFYVSTVPSNSFLATIFEFTNSVIIEILEILVNVQSGVDDLIDILCETSTSSSRRKHELFKENLENYSDSHEMQKRSVCSIISLIWILITLFPKFIRVDVILRANEYTHDFNEGSVKSYDSNQLASNNPIEDTRSEASCLLTTGFLVGVFDGHGGGACAQVIAKRLYHYLTACLLPHESLMHLFTNPHPSQLIQSYNDKVQFVDDVREIYQNSFVEFLKDLTESNQSTNFDMHKAIERAFLRLDEDLSKEALPKEGEPLNLKTLSVAMSGAVVCVAHIDGPHLHIANVGDCCAVLGTLSETNSWVASKLTIEHNSYNQSEVDRILKEHPYSESLTVLKMDRLLGQLAPLRAMGDFRFKWSKDIMTSLLAKHFGEQIIPPNYHTPPYLLAKPEVTQHKLTPRDKFLIIATDGLWDVMTPLQAVRLVGEHMKGKVTLNPLKLPRKNMTLGEINELLLQRKEGLKMKPKDSNGATHLIRNALGGTEFGIDHSKISQLLSLPEDVVRVFRDDMTVTIIYFDSEYLRHCPA